MFASASSLSGHLLTSQITASPDCLRLNRASSTLNGYALAFACVGGKPEEGASLFLLDPPDLIRCRSTSEI
jgi:hypothetical protein